MLRIRDFIETKEGLIFSSVSYHHPADRYHAYLRYYPSSNGGRERGRLRYAKVTSTADAQDYLIMNYPHYVNSKGQWVLKDRVKKVYRPEARLNQILREPRDVLEEKVRKLSEIFSAIPADKKGVTGSILVDLHSKNSDIDFVVYGVKNHMKARLILKNMIREGVIGDLSRRQWRRVYEKRFPKEKTLSFKEFLWHESRKWHRGVIDGTIFDILLVRQQHEGYQTVRKKLTVGPAVLRCMVVDDTLAFDSPAVYRVKFEDGTLGEVFSYTHTYAGQAFKGETVEARGILEITEKDELRMVVGTTREAEGEYIKVVSLHD